MEEVNKTNDNIINKCPKQLSSSLKERLKRCGRYYSSPVPSKNPKLDPGFLPTPDSISSSQSSLNCSTPTVTRPFYETPPCSILTPSSSEDPEDSSFDDSTSLSCTPVLKTRDSQGSHPKAKRLRLSSRACFSVNISPDCRSDSLPEEEDGNLPEQELSASPLEDDRLQITACGDGKHWDSKSSGETPSSVVSGSCLLSGDVSNCEGQDDEQSVEVVPKNLSCEELVSRKIQLQKNLKEKQECLRKLRMVKLYRSKNDLSSLDELIVKWRGVSQQVLLDLYEKLPEPKPTLSGLLQHLHLDQKFLRFDPEEETFY